MSASANKVILIGNLGADPEIHHTAEGRAIVNFSVATSESWKDKNTGNRMERTEWHRVVIFAQGLTKVAEKYLHKGDKVYLEGKLRTRKWQDKDGNDRYSTEVVLQAYDATLTMLDSKRNGNGAAARSTSPSANDGGANPPQPPAATGSDQFDDDIPF